MTTPAMNQSPQPVQRQVKLPLTKAVEIAWKNIRMRLSRSLLVTSGIVLALAFLISIQTTESMMVGMRTWINEVPESVAFDRLRWDVMRLTSEGKPLEVDLRNLSRGVKLKGNPVPFDAGKAFGSSLPEIQKELGELPGTPDELLAAFATKPEAVEKFKAWLSNARQLPEARDRLTAPQRLAADMKKNGVPTTPEEIESNRIQTRWLLGLALLVAFVGILNAMVMSVTERFREIGTMKCLGALDSFIIRLFLIESLFQGIVGTVLGLVVGLGMSALALTSTYGSFAWRNVPWSQLGGNVVFCFFVGVALTVAGALYPAWQAARMEPIAAMRVEA